MKATRITMTNHIKEERLDRLTYIALNVGFGNVILEHIREEDGRRDCLTDTGVLMIKAAHEEILITAFVANIDKVTAIYHKCGYTSVPANIRKVVLKNEKHNKMQNIVRY